MSDPMVVNLELDRPKQAKNHNKKSYSEDLKYDHLK